MISALEALRDRNLFGAAPAFADLSTWRPWLAFLAALYGLPLDAEGEALFRKCTGRTVYAPPPGGWREVVCIVGRQAGKTRVSAFLVAFEAALAEPSRDGELYALLLAQDWRAAIRASFSYIRSMLDASPILRRAITRETTDTIDLENGLRIATYPCRPSSVRGLRARIVLLDELAFFRSGDGIAVDTEMLRAVRPALATTGGKLVVISSPYAQAGALYDLHRRHFGRDDSPVLVWQADAPTMNPCLPADYLERMREEDPEAYRSEVLGEFRTGLSLLLDPEALDRCVVPGRVELPPVSGVHYRAFVDPSGGRADAFTLAVAHQEGGRAESPAVVDVVRAWRPPLNPSGVVAEAAELLRGYGVQRVTGDRYAGEWPREQFRAHGIAYDVAEKPKSELYLDFVAHVNGARVELPEVRDLLRELRLLERRRGASGKDRVDHPPGAHDDQANAVAGVAALFLSRQQEATWSSLYTGRDRGDDDGFEIELPRARGFATYSKGFGQQEGDMDFGEALDAMDWTTAVHETGHALAIAPLVPSRRLLYAENRGLGSGRAWSEERAGVLTPPDEGLALCLAGIAAELELLDAEPWGFRHDGETIGLVLLGAGVPREKWRGRIEHALARLRVFMRANRDVVAEAARELRRRGTMTAEDFAPYIARLEVPAEDAAERLARAVVASYLVGSIVERTERGVDAALSRLGGRVESLGDVLRAKQAEAR